MPRRLNRVQWTEACSALALLYVGSSTFPASSTSAGPLAADVLALRNNTAVDLHHAWRRACTAYERFPWEVKIIRRFCPVASQKRNDWEGMDRAESMQRSVREQSLQSNMETCKSIESLCQECGRASGVTAVKCVH
jgi:hypothetical protein